MQKNIGTTDRLIRLVMAVIISLVFFLKAITWSTSVISIFLGVSLLFTSLSGFSILYDLLGIDTTKNNHSHGKARN